MGTPLCITPQFPAPGSQQRVSISSSSSQGRNKVALKPSHSLMDWIQLTRSGKDMTGLGGQFIEVSEEELSKNNKINDVHQWVNAESMLEKCLTGKLKITSPINRRVLELKAGVQNSLTVNGPTSPSLLPRPKPPDLQPPKGNQDTKLFCLNLPAGTRLCVSLGYHVYITNSISGTEVVRSYTVVLPSLNKEYQDPRVLAGQVIYLMLKIYPDGAITPWLGSLKEGEMIQVSKFDGNFSQNELQDCSHLILYAAGTGFTPIFTSPLWKTLSRED